MNRLEKALRAIAGDLTELGCNWALVGGLAVSARAEPRTTRDVDVAIAVPDDTTAEAIVHALRGSGYRIVKIVEQKATHRLATARLRSRAEVIVDILFASSGIEREIATEAEVLEVLPRLRVPIAKSSHLIAMKVLARDDRTRPQDWDDLKALLSIASKRDLEDARKALRLIATRGFARRRDLARLLASAQREMRPAKKRPRARKRATKKVATKLRN